MIKLKTRLKQELIARLKGSFPLPEPEIEIAYPPQQSLGDLSFTF